MAWPGTLGAQLAVEFGCNVTAQPAAWPAVPILTRPCMTSTPSRPNLPAIAGLVFWIGRWSGSACWIGRSSPSAWLPVQAFHAHHLVDGLFSFETAVATSSSPGGVGDGWVDAVQPAAKYDISDARAASRATPSSRSSGDGDSLLLVHGIAY